VKSCFFENIGNSLDNFVISVMERLRNMENIKQCSFRCPESIWKRFKLYCTYNNIACQDQLTTLIEQFINNEESEIRKNAGKELKKHLQSIPRA